MNPKKKKCKGNGVTKGYGCSTITLYRTLGLCSKCYPDWLLNTEEGKERLSRAITTAKKASEKQEKQKIKELNSEIIDWKPKLQVEVNKIVRLIDKGSPCLARGKFGQIHAGHIYARGGNQTIRYNLHNIHRQNAQSNHFSNDDGLLREGLTKEYGQDYMDFVSSLRATPTLQWKNKDYERLTINARKIVLRLTKENKTYNLEQRLELRNIINLELGIYNEDYCIFKK